jgi:O-antigen ligase/Flp pilus assembly protein TadD
MQNDTGIRKSNFFGPAFWIGLGLCFVALAPVVPIVPRVQTFIHPWRPELAASLFLVCFLVWTFFRGDIPLFFRRIRREETLAIVLPCTVFIAWSFISVFFAGSSRSALHHTFVWAVYLIFYIVVRFYSNTPAETRNMGTVILAAVWIISLPAVFEYYTMVNAQDATTIGIRYSKYAEMMNTLFPLIAAFSLRSKGRAFWIGIATVVLIELLVITSLSRTAAGLYLIGFLMMAAAIFGLQRFHHYRKKFALLVLLLVAVPLLLQAPSFFASNSVSLVDRMADQATVDSTNVRPFFSGIALEMLKKHPVTGVGADNFGREFTRYRETYAAGHPSDPNLAIAEGEIAERAHNEFSQVGAELGIPGLVLMGWFLLGLGWLAFRAARRYRTISLPAIGALAGLALFLASSLVTSYSFRMVQNGLVFFFVLAIAVKEILPDRLNGAENRPAGAGFARTVLAIGLACCFALASLSILRAAGVWYGHRAAGAGSFEETSGAFDTSFRLDPENASMHAVFGLYLFQTQKFKEAAPEFGKTIDLGRATSIDYSYLASAHLLAGELDSAEKTLAEAVRIYPASTFLRTKYGALLKDLGKNDAAEEQFAKARTIDPRQAETWRNLIENGAVSASKRSFDGKLLPVMDLKPKDAIYAVLAEREVVHPEEKSDFHF